MEIPLHDALGRVALAVWPRRSQRELLLDLGERKRWGADECTDALSRAARHLHDEHAVAASLAVYDASVDEDPKTLHGLGESLATRGELGVARWLRGLAPALGVSPKTLANGVSSLQDDRPEHRWIRAIARCLRGERRRDAWAYHLRTSAAVARSLGEVWGGRSPDAGDAVLAMSLLAAWQRRRPSAEARANKGRVTPRRHTPKPAAALVGTLLMPGQVEPLVKAALHLGGLAGQELALLTFEAALTEAHLTAHRPRANGAPDDARGGALLRLVEGALRDAEPLLGADDVADLRFRIDRMRAYREGRSQLAAEGAPVRSDYARASLALERRRRGEPAGAGPFDPSAPGLMMLLPLLRSRGLLVNHEP